MGELFLMLVTVSYTLIAIYPFIHKICTVFGFSFCPSPCQSFPLNCFVYEYIEVAYEYRYIYIYITQ